MTMHKRALVCRQVSLQLQQQLPQQLQGQHLCPNLKPVRIQVEDRVRDEVEFDLLATTRVKVQMNNLMEVKARDWMRSQVWEQLHADA